MEHLAAPITLGISVAFTLTTIALIVLSVGAAVIGWFRRRTALTLFCLAGAAVALMPVLTLAQWIVEVTFNFPAEAAPSVPGLVTVSTPQNVFDVILVVLALVTIPCAVVAVAVEMRLLREVDREIRDARHQP